MTSEFVIAVYALVCLNREGTTVASEVLAEKVCTNPVRIRKVMAKMRKKGLVGTKEGINGGYYMIWKAEEVNLAQICDALGAEAVVPVGHLGSRGRECMAESGMEEVMDGIYGELNKICRQKLMEITIQDVEDRSRGKQMV